MSIWHSNPTLEVMNAANSGTISEHIGIEFTEIGDDYLAAKMPVDSRTVQPYGIVHGGASVTLAETLGSTGAFLVAGPEKRVLGLEINANHLAGASSGYVYGKATPLHIGRTTQVWEIKIHREDGKLSCISRLTVAVRDNPEHQ